MRKQLHNYIQVLKGSIRVFCRVKPLSNPSSELQLELRKSGDYNKNVITFPQCLKNEFPSQLEIAADNSSKLYHFDCIFPPDCT